MTLGKILWLLGLFATAYAHSTCTDLSWESTAQRENFKLYNAGNHILVLNSMKLECSGGDESFVYRNKSFLLNPGQRVNLPGDALSKCSATFCSACLIYQCDVIVQLNPNATLAFLYNVTNSGVEFPAVGHTYLPREKKSSHNNTVCPKYMTSTWLRKLRPKILVDIPNRKKKKTVYTVEVVCNDSYLLDKNKSATNYFIRTTPRVKSRGEVTMLVPLNEQRETSGTCTLNACLHKRRKCKQKVSCKFTIPDDSVRLKKLYTRKKPTYKRVSCSQTRWVWSPLDEQTGNLNLNLHNKDWRDKLFRISVRCKELSTLNDTVLITIPPMVQTRFVTFPLTISAIRNTTKRTRCVVKLCNTAKARCGRTTKCSIALPVKNGKFKIHIPVTNNTESSSACDSESVTWTLTGTRRGVLAVKLSNAEQESITANVSLSCHELDILRATSLAVELNANSIRTLEFKLRPNIVNNSLVETYCTVKVCNNNEDCESQENYCTMRIRIPVTNGLFPYDESNGMTNDEVNELLPLDEGNSESNGLSDERRKRQMPNLLDYYKRKVTTPCPSDIIFFNRSSSDIPTLFVNIENRKRKPLPYMVKVSCDNINVLQDNGTVSVSGSVTKTIPSIQSGAQEIVEFTFQDNYYDNMAKACILRVCVQRAAKCFSQIACEIAGTSFNDIFNPPPMVSNKSCGHFKWTWTAHKPQRGVFDVVLHNNLLDEVVFNVTLECSELKVFNNSVTTVLMPMTYNKTVSYTLEPLSLHKLATTAECVVKICKNDCINELVCNAEIPVKRQVFITPVNASTSTLMPQEQYENYTECAQKDAVWEVDQPGRGILKVKAYNSEQEETEVLIVLQCRNVEAVSDKVSELATVPGKSFRPVKFRFKPKIDPLVLNDTNETHCVVNVCIHDNCATERETCIIRIPIMNGNFVLVKPPRKKDNETKFISHKCHNHHEIHSHAPCHDKMWNLAYTPAQLEGEALLIITLNLKSKKPVDLRTDVTLGCEGIIIEDDAQQTLLLSKYERQRNVSFAIATIRSLPLERHVCTLNVIHSLLIPSEDNITDDAIEELCLREEKCTIAIDSRLGRIVPKCRFHKVQSSINSTKVDQKAAKVTFSVAPSVYDVFTYDAYCSENNPFTHDSVKEKKKNTFVSESKTSKVLTVDYAPDCDNDTIRKEFENYRKDDCDFLLYGYCQGGELLLENLEDIKFDNDQMYCTPDLLFNKWLQSIQKHTGIHNKPVAAILAIFIVIIILLITIVIPVIIVVYFCCCRHHRDDAAKRQSIGIVISSCDEWEETNAMLNAMSEQNSKYLTGRSDQKFPNSKESSYDSVPGESDVETPIYRFNGDSVKQHNQVNRVDSLTFHDSEAQHDHHKPSPFDQKGPTDQSIRESIIVNTVIKQLELINEASPEEQNSKLSETRTDFSSTLNGWGDEHADDDEGELMQSTDF